MRHYFLQTARLGFRTWCEEDFDLAKSLLGDESVMKHIDIRLNLSNQEIKEKLHHEIEKDRRYGVQYWPIFLHRTSDFIGCCGLRPYNLNELSYEIGFHICSKHWGKGYAKESAKAVIHHGFNKMGIQRILAGHNPKNKQSERILDQLGFTYSHDEYFKPTGMMHPIYFIENRSL